MPLKRSLCIAPWILPSHLPLFASRLTAMPVTAKSIFHSHPTMDNKTSKLFRCSFVSFAWTHERFRIAPLFVPSYQTVSSTRTCNVTETWTCCRYACSLLSWCRSIPLFRLLLWWTAGVQSCQGRYLNYLWYACSSIMPICMCNII